MKLFAISCLLLLAPAPLALAAADVTVQLGVGAGTHLAPSLKACDVGVPAGSNAGEVLDAATASGCISGWEYDDSFGARFVTCIDGVCAPLGTFWAFFVDGDLPDACNAGIDDVALQGGENVEFVLADWFTPFTLDGC